MKRPHQTECQQIVQMCDPRENRAENWIKSWRRNMVTTRNYSEHTSRPFQRTLGLNKHTVTDSKHWTVWWMEAANTRAHASGHGTLDLLVPCPGICRCMVGNETKWSMWISPTLMFLNHKLQKAQIGMRCYRETDKRPHSSDHTFPVSCAGEQMHFLMIKHHMSEPANAFLFFMDCVSLRKIRLCFWNQPREYYFSGTMA